MADLSTDDGVDERARTALEALRRAGAEPLDPAGRGAPWPGHGLFLRLDDELAHRWPGGPTASTVLVVGAAVLALAVGAWWLTTQSGGATGGTPPVTLPFTTTTVPGPQGAAPAGSSGGATTTTTAPTLVVHAAGAVARPGVHVVASGSRVADVLAAAGGAAPDADLDRVNLAASVQDGERLYVPRQGEVTAPPVVSGQGGVAPGAAAGESGSAGSGPVDLNTATAEQLDALPGVGPSTAQAILAHRESHGPFTSVDGLLDVRGIGPAKLEALRDLVVVG